MYRPDIDHDAAEPPHGLTFALGMIAGGVVVGLAALLLKLIG